MKHLWWVPTLFSVISGAVSVYTTVWWCLTRLGLFVLLFKKKPFVLSLSRVIFTLCCRGCFTIWRISCDCDYMWNVAWCWFWRFWFCDHWPLMTTDELVTGLSPDRTCWWNSDHLSSAETTCSPERKRRKKHAGQRSFTTCRFGP